MTELAEAKTQNTGKANQNSNKQSYPALDKLAKDVEKKDDGFMSYLNEFIETILFREKWYKQKIKSLIDIIKAQNLEKLLLEKKPGETTDNSESNKNRETPKSDTSSSGDDDSYYTDVDYDDMDIGSAGRNKSVDSTIDIRRKYQRLADKLEKSQEQPKDKKSKDKKKGKKKNKKK